MDSTSHREPLGLPLQQLAITGQHNTLGAVHTAAVLPPSAHPVTGAALAQPHAPALGAPEPSMEGTGIPSALLHDASGSPMSEDAMKAMHSEWRAGAQQDADAATQRQAMIEQQIAADTTLMSKR